MMDPHESIDYPTLDITWVCTALATVLIILRLLFRRHRAERLYPDDIWMTFSLIPLLLRVVFIHITLTFLTSNFNRSLYTEAEMSAEVISHRRLGSIMILPGRVAYAGFIWCMKVCILLWIKTKVTGNLAPYGALIRILYVLLGASYAMVVIATFLECRPMKRYWQVWPDPGRCVKANAQLVTMGVFNIATDIPLILLPLPILFKSRLPMLRKLQLFVLFGVSFFVISITIIRMPIIISDNSLQKARTLWASIECLAACAVANAPVLNAFLHEHIQKRRDAQHDIEMAKGEGGAACENRRRIMMPVTGQDSSGSLTRNNGLSSVGMTSISGEHEEGWESPGKTSSWGGGPGMALPAEKPAQAFLLPEMYKSSADKQA